MASLHVGVLAVLLVAVLAACASGDQRLIDVGDGRQLYLDCEGEAILYGLRKGLITMPSEEPR